MFADNRRNCECLSGMARRKRIVFGERFKIVLSLMFEWPYPADNRLDRPYKDDGSDEACGDGIRSHDFHFAAVEYVAAQIESAHDPISVKDTKWCEDFCRIIGHYIASRLDR